MATVNDWTDPSSYTGNRRQPAEGLGSVVTVKKRYIDTSSSNQASGEYYRLQQVAANTIIRVTAVTETVEGAADTLDVSFVLDSDTAAASPVSIISNFDVNTDAQTNTGTITTTAAGDVCVKPDAALATCKYWIVIETITLRTTD